MNDTVATSWVVSVAGRKCAAGLAWVPLIATERKGVRQELQQHLKRSGSAFGALFPQRDARYTLAGIVKPRRAGASVGTSGRTPVATWLAASVNRFTVVVTEHGNGLWVLAADEGSIDPRGDAVIPSRDLTGFVDDVTEAARSTGAAIDIVLSPECAGRAESLEHLGKVRVGSLDELLTAPVPKVRVKKHVGIPTWAFQGGVAIAVVGGMAWAALVLTQQLADQLARKQADEIARQQVEDKRLQAMRANSQAHQAVEQQVRAVTATPAPMDLAAACIEAWERLPDTLGGWVRESQSCAISGVVQITYRLPEKGGGISTEQSLRAAASVRNLSVDIQWFNSTATVAAQTEPLAAREGLRPEGLPNLTDAGTALASHAQRIRRVMPELQLVATAPSPAPAAPGSGTESTVAPLPYQTGTLLMSGKSMWLLRAVVPSAPNVTLNTITLRREAGSLQWTAEGSFVTSRT